MAIPPSRPIGYLGAGPWPLAPRAILTPGMGILEAIVVGATTDEAENLWVANAPPVTAVMPGAAALSIASPSALATSTPSVTDPERHHGKLDLVRLRADGSLEVHFIDVYNSNASYY